jgi:hypothetical protein
MAWQDDQRNVNTELANNLRTDGDCALFVCGVAARWAYQLAVATSAIELKSLRPSFSILTAQDVGVACVYFGNQRVYGRSRPRPVCTLLIHFFREKKISCACMRQSSVKGFHSLNLT